ncbi:uncharacterized protein BP01DRAFT_361097 [Aspergillus saccharolyticus JOP 1030-1]|uniref:Cyanovirin-N domain-containing protein n=1 Tax=Aspergillus saccharolyticus JOP 1030-1 TaxID=1450539 RepID=A0A318Z785_9EURO|nr:hypothetical protein BP01DRAFT_361097 [Aspergillus saccharolyticus JOP 1030-1]PYH40593.1 hypothetical protein BP01DRAFT_361097 [Aspergillus saccharolyticus JOP 1030-1]
MAAWPTTYWKDFSSTCHAIDLGPKGSLTATCSALNGTQFESRLELSQCYVNRDGNLSPLKSGDAFADCGGCLSWLDPNVSNHEMSTACPGSGKVYITYTDLDTTIYNRNGLLGCFGVESQTILGDVQTIKKIGNMSKSVSNMASSTKSKPTNSS